MKKIPRIIPEALALLAFALYSAICYHSVEEIHYLKGFFPGSFTVEEAYHAALIELIKIVIIGIPFLLFIALCLFFIRNRRR